MTPGEIADHKEKIKKVMLDHLTPLGWPQAPNELVMHELKAMWLKIEEAGLILPGMTFEYFCAHANNQFLMAEVDEIMGI